MKKALLIVSIAAAVLSLVSALGLVFLYIDGAVDVVKKVKSFFSFFGKKALKQ